MISGEYETPSQRRRALKRPSSFAPDMASACALPRGQLRGGDAAVALRSRRVGVPARRVVRAFPVAASADRRAAAVSMAPAPGTLAPPAGLYCESHYKAIRRPTRCARDASPARTPAASRRVLRWAAA